MSPSVDVDLKMDKENLISTGIEKLDKLLEGGIPEGFITVILGSPGSSIEILSKQLADSMTTLYITTEETKEEVKKTMDRFNWDHKNLKFIDIASKYYGNLLKGEEKRVSVYEQRSKIKLKELIEAGSSGTPHIKEEEDEDFLAVLLNKIKAPNPNKIILNSLDFFLDQYSEEEVLKVLKAAKLNTVQNNGALFIFMTKGVHGEILEKKIESLFDCVIELDLLQKGSAFERFLAVKKMKNYAKKIGIARYSIDSDGFSLETIERIT